MTPLRGEEALGSVRYAHEPQKTFFGVSKLALRGGASVTLVGAGRQKKGWTGFPEQPFF